MTPFQSQRSSLRSRVTPAVSCTTAARLCVSRLTSVDFPTFGKPTIATVPALLTASVGRLEASSAIPAGAPPAGCRRRGGRAGGRRRASRRGAGSRPGAARRPPCSRARPSAARRSVIGSPQAIDTGWKPPRASSPACRGSRPGRSARPPAARPSRRPAAPRRGRPSAAACPPRRGRARAPRATIRRIVRTASRSDSPRRTGKQPNVRMNAPNPGTRCASIFAM